MNTAKTEAVLVQLAGKVVGPVPVKRLYDLKGFNAQTLVSYPGSDKWAAAWRVLNMKTYEPPVAMNLTGQFVGEGMNFSHLFTAPLQIQFMHTLSSTVNPDEEAWVNLWFRRLAIFNAIIALTAALAWYYPLVTKHTSQTHLLAMHKQRQYFNHRGTRGNSSAPVSVTR